MNIQPLYSINFGVNLNSTKLKFSRNDFFVKINGYGKNNEWADEVIKTADLGSSLICRGTTCENILKIIAAGVKRANHKNNDLNRAINTGILRVNRDGWFSKIADAYTNYKINRYKSYEERLNLAAKNSFSVPNEKVAITTIEKKSTTLKHGDPLRINNSLEYIFKLFNKLFPKYLDKVTQADLTAINETIAEIRWVMAHATPWLRGSDAISNVFMRSMYKALGIKSFPLKKGVSLDFEAYCTNLTEYKKNFVSLFEAAPKIVQ